MPVKLTTSFTVPEGKTYISLTDWVKTLSAEDQAAYAAADAEMQAMKSQNTTAGHLALVDQKLSSGFIKAGQGVNTIEVYTDEALALKSSGQIDFVPSSWKAFWDRYQAETGIVYTTSTETV
jgi:hypothetical protein